jgi:hypothetical protein
MEHLATASSVDAPPLELTVASWILRVPGAHPFWAFYWIGCVSLKPMAGVPPAIINLPGATHEILLFALNPEIEPALDAEPAWMEPINFAAQFIEPNDHAAAVRIRATVQDVIDGTLNPDTDARSQWIARFGDNGRKNHHHLLN